MCVIEKPFKRLPECYPIKGYDVRSDVDGNDVDHCHSSENAPVIKVLAPFMG